MNDNYLNIEYAHYDGKDIAVQIRAHFLEVKPDIAVKYEIWDEESGQMVNSFIERADDELSLTVNKKFAVSGGIKRKLAVKAGFMWLDDAGELLFGSDMRQLADPNDVLVPCNITITKPRAKDKKETKLVYWRDGDFDYRYPKNKVEGGKLKVLLPFDGSVKLDSDEWKIIEIADGSVPEFPAPSVSLFLSGGGSVNYNKDMISQFVIEQEGKTVSWIFNDDWDTYFDAMKITSSCILEFHCKLSLRLQNISDPDFYRYETVTISSTPVELDEYEMLERIEPIRLYFGCMAKDTKILMADGSEKPVSDINVGDSVHTTDGACEVTDIITGFEETLVSIQAENNRVIRVTGDHPVKTKRGFVRADNLNAADIVVLNDGLESHICALYHDDYMDKVFNISTTKPKSAFVGNGFIIGDFGMQNDMNAENAKPIEYPDNVRASKEAFDELIGAVERIGIEKLETTLTALSQQTYVNCMPSQIIVVQAGGIKDIVRGMSRA